MARECVEHCKSLDYPNFEILLLSDDEEEGLNGVRVIATGALSPGAKRNVGIMDSDGEFCAFIDSDADPRRDWLKNAVKYLKGPEVGAVGGPGITPENATLMEKASGYVLHPSWLENLPRRRRAAFRRGVWFRALNRVERGVVDLTMKYVDDIKSTKLAKVLTAILEKLRLATEGMAERLVRTVGVSLAQKMSDIAVSWGNLSASKWAQDPGFAIYLVVNACR